MLVHKHSAVPIFCCIAAVLASAATSHATPIPPVRCDNLVFPGGAPACRDYIGDAWNPGTASADCAAIPGVTQPGAVAVGAFCDPASITGTCTVDPGLTSETRLHFAGGDLATLETSCVSFLHGSWSTPIAGSCQHMMVFGPPGSPAMPVCKQYDGAAFPAATAAADCAALTSGAFSDQACDASPIGACQLAGSSLHFASGDAASLEAGCEGTPPFGLGGQWVAAQAPSLPPEVVTALSSDSSVTVTPDACVDDACLAGLLPGKSAITFQPAGAQATTGLVIYPGGMVEPRAYAVAARAIAAQGFFVALVPFPGNLPITDPMRALPTLMGNPQIQRWAIAGHSLGGVAASILAAANPMGKLSGIAFWASYPAPAMGQSPAVDLSSTQLKGLSLAGDLDGVLNWNAYEQTKTQLPAKTWLATIRGGNHAQFGYYGIQTGDQQARLSRERQHSLFVGATIHLLNRLGLPADQDAGHPIYDRIDNLAAQLCTPAQLHIAQMKRKDLGAPDVLSTTYDYEDDFVLSKPEFPSDGSGLVSVTAYARQGANPWDVTAPPVLDDEVWCKMKSQEAIAAQYGIRPQHPEGSCEQVNRWVFDAALAQVDTLTFLRYLFSGTRLQFADDTQTASGPAWLGGEVGLIDLGGRRFSINAVQLRTPLQGPPPPYNGSYYCRVWSPVAAAKFIVARARTAGF